MSITLRAVSLRKLLDRKGRREHARAAQTLVIEDAGPASTRLGESPVPWAAAVELAVPV